MKKRLFITGLVFVFIFSFSFNLFSQNLNVKQLNLVTNRDFVVKKAKLNKVAEAARKRGVKPGAFKNASYKLQDNVVVLAPQVKNNLQRKIAQMPVLNSSVLNRMNVTKNKVYFDPKSELVFKPVEIGTDSLVLAKPKINEVFKDVNIPLQTVPFTLANTDYTLEGTTVTDEVDDDGIYTMRMEFNNKVYTFNKKVKSGNQKGETSIKLTLNGFVGFTDPKIEARYTYNDGYKITFLAKEKVDLTASADVELKYDLSFPIWGYTIPIDDWGSCKIGVFLVLDVDGKVYVEMRMEQTLSVMAGIHGKTIMMVPRSLKTDVDIEKGYDLGYSYNGSLTAFGGVECTAELTLKGYDLLKLRARGGLELKAAKSDTTAFSVEIGAKILVDGKLQIKSYKKKFTVYEKYFLLWKKQEPDFGGYILTIKNADAYHDRVWGSVLEIDSTAYSGNLTLIVTHPNGSKNRYSGTTDSEGIFAMTGIDLKKGDKVQVQIGNKEPSEPVYASLPFKGITLAYADYYTNTVSGSVASYIDYFPKKSQNVSSGGTSKIAGLNTGVIKNTGGVKIADKSLLMPKIKISKEMLDNAVTYSGDVQIITEPIAHKAHLTLPAVGTGTTTTTHSNHRPRVGVVGVKMPGAQSHKYDKIKKIDVLATKKVVNLPFGMFVVKNVNIKPGQRVKARINIDGFILESEPVVSDGLIFTPIEDTNVQGSFLTQTIKADDSYAVVNAFRSDVSPTGKIKLIKGIDMKHTSPHTQMPNQHVDIPKLSEFKNAIHPLVYFNVDTELKPMPDNRGFSVAHTGPWHVNNIYYNSRNIVSLQRTDGHRFEYTGYTYDGEWTGYKYYQKECRMDKSSARNSLNKPGKSAVPVKHIPPGKKIGGFMH